MRRNLTSPNHKVGSFFLKPAFTKCWFVPVWLMLGISRLMIVTLTFRRIAPYLGKAVGVSAYSHILEDKQETQALRIARVVRLTARYCPWVSNCFPQAITARLLLGIYRIPYSLYFGLCRDPETNQFKAHAWVTAGRIPVSGGQSFQHYTIVGCYIRN
ncbi:lasso peptide biosynthesis B2 protein [Vreelandella neptunia]|uniref:Lasso peptide biosynthesis B2 protein n=1 Tax=Vreelandella neptunia TaxID=115551 RepID=A0ABS9S763_9GAMM|nr:lasso peptide biosynthesis B2 protein [Halomonas neptunia]MCH4811957.1 lasso peptide biosynthesis B2 protein [Halomonas neptunia]